MKNINIFLFILITIAFSACEKNYDDTNTLTLDDDPTAIELSELKGLVSNPEGAPISNAEVSILHNKELFVVKTDPNGRYQIELPRDEKEVFLLADSPEHVKSGIDKKVLNQESVSNDFIIATPAEMPFQESPNVASLNDSLRVISGRLFYANGNPLAGKMVFLVNPVDITQLFSVYEITDTDGRFSFAYPSTTDLILFTYDKCNELQIITETLTVGEEDVDIGDFTTTSVESESLVFSGFITDCNTGDGLRSGSVIITLDGQNSIYTDILNGVYYTPVENCFGATCYDIKIITNELVDADIEQECVPINASIENQTYELCGDPVVSNYEGEVRLLIGTDSLIFDQGSATLLVGNDGWEIGGLNEDIFLVTLFQINGNSPGTYPIQFIISDFNQTLRYWQFDQSLMSATIDVIGEYIEGTVNGEIVDAVGNTYATSGTFKIKI